MNVTQLMDKLRELPGGARVIVSLDLKTTLGASTLNIDCYTAVKDVDAVEVPENNEVLLCLVPDVPEVH